MNISSTNELFVPTYARSGAPMVKGKGAWLYDSTGKKYLDFGTGIAVTALGHAHPEICAALKKQGSMLLHASNLYHQQPQIDLAKLLVRHSFGDCVFFCNSGTEAVEAAIKFARKRASRVDPKKITVHSFTDGFHGRTYGALSATAQKKFHQGFKPIVPGFTSSPYNDIDSAKKILDKRKYAAVIVEPVQGEGGFNQASTEFLVFLREYTAAHDISLVFDEIQCGLGRTGTLWNYEQHGLTPDMMTLAKPLGGGLPLGAVVCTSAQASVVAPGDHGTTFGGNPLACALGSVVLRTVSKKGFLREVVKKGELLHAALETCTAECARVKCVVGVGLMVGVRMHEDPGTVIAACRERGLLVVKAGHNTVRFIPPLTVDTAGIHDAVERFARALQDTAQ